MFSRGVFKFRTAKNSRKISTSHKKSVKFATFTAGKKPLHDAFLPTAKNPCNPRRYRLLPRSRIPRRRQIAAPPVPIPPYSNPVGDDAHILPKPPSPREVAVASATDGGSSPHSPPPSKPSPRGRFPPIAGENVGVADKRGAVSRRAKRWHLRSK